MAYTPNTDLLNDDEDRAEEHPAQPQPSAPPPRSSIITRLMVGLILLGILAFIAVKIGRLYGYDLVQAVQDAVVNRNPAFIPAQSTATQARPGAMPVPGTPVRDIPPQVDPNKPDFSLRDGVTYGYITNLDSETLQRLDGVVGQLDQMVGYTEKMGQAVRQFAAMIVPRMQQVEQQQAQLTLAMTQLLAQLQRIDASVQDIRVSLLQPGSIKTAKPIPKGSPIRGWSVHSINNGRAWLKAPNGTVITVVNGERLKTLGEIVDVDDRRVVLIDGRYIE